MSKETVRSSSPGVGNLPGVVGWINVARSEDRLPLVTQLLLHPPLPNCCYCTHDMTAVKYHQFPPSSNCQWHPTLTPARYNCMAGHIQLASYNCQTFIYSDILWKLWKGLMSLVAHWATVVNARFLKSVSHKATMWSTYYPATFNAPAQVTH